MRFVSIREIRNRPGRVWAALAEDDLVLTQHGKPIALMTSVGPDDFEMKAAALRRARLGQAVARVRAAAAEAGTNRLSDEEIDAVIGETRQARDDT